MKELAEYLIRNLIVDFEGEVTADTVRAFLRKDDSEKARVLLQKITNEEGIEDLLITLADCLTSNLTTGINEEVIQEHLVSYAES